MGCIKSITGLPSVLKDPSQPQYLAQLGHCFHFGLGPDMCGKFKRLETITDRKKGMDNDVSMVVDVEEMEIVGPLAFINIIITYSLQVAPCGQKDEELGKMSSHAFPLANMN